MNVKVRLFASTKDLAGFSERNVSLPEAATTDDVWSYLEEQNNRFRAWRPSLRFAVNEEYVPGSTSLKEGDEVSVIPPVSGG